MLDNTEASAIKTANAKIQGSRLTEEVKYASNKFNERSCLEVIKESSRGIPDGHINNLLLQPKPCNEGSTGGVSQDIDPKEMSLNNPDRAQAYDSFEPTPGLKIINEPQLQDESQEVSAPPPRFG